MLLAWSFSSFLISKYFNSPFARIVIWSYFLTFCTIIFISLTDLCPNGSLLTSSAVSLYSLLQLASLLIALFRDPVAGSMAANIKMIFWLVSMAINLYYSHSILVPPPSPVVTQIEMSMKGADENRSVSSSDNLRHRRLSSLPEDQFTSLLQEASYQKAPLTPLSDIRQYKIFHILIVLSSLFLYVILTNWDSCSALYLSIAKEVQSESSGSILL
eukprot:GHVP01033977.1.p1 GENE.GHVP01033977.1~~GHVP01033977.1.p1  ORF type:complete len:215 (+),score=20.61 GHVP01033977.1:544-1188(+)